MARAKLAVADRDRLLPAAGHGGDVRADSSAQNGHAKAAGVGKGNVAPAGVLALQRRIGNRSTVALLQRDPEDEDLEAAAAMFQTAESAARPERGVRFAASSPNPARHGWTRAVPRTEANGAPEGGPWGGAKEAVIDQVGAGKYGESGEGAGLATRSKLADLEKDGILKVELDTSMSANTKRVLQEMGQLA